MMAHRLRVLGAWVCLAYFASGATLFILTQRMAQLCMGDDGCVGKPALVVRAFQLDVVYWLLPAAIATLSVLLTSRVAPRALLALDVVLIVILAVLVIHVLDLLLGQIFCHEWGCSFLLPTWTLFVVADP
jgi:hypothetical protein